MGDDSFFAEPRNWVGLAFVVFFVLFGRTLWGALMNILDARTAAVRATLAEAQTLRTEAEEMLRDAKSRREAALVEASRLLESAKAEAAHLAAAAATEAQAAAGRRERMALDRIAAAEKAAIDEVRIAAADIATQAAMLVLRDGLSAEADGALIDRAISGLPASLATRHAA